MPPVPMVPSFSKFTCCDIAGKRWKTQAVTGRGKNLAAAAPGVLESCAPKLFI